MHQFAQVICKCVSISEDPQAKKRLGITNKEDNCRDVCVVRVTTTILVQRVLLSGLESVVATISLIDSRYVQPGLFKSLVWVVEE